MKDPDELFPPRKAAEFDESGRPYNSMFYTCRPNFYQALHVRISTLFTRKTKLNLTFKFTIVSIRIFKEHSRRNREIK